MASCSIFNKELTSLHLWQRAEQKRVPLSFDLELTNRCNNNCRHCYINMPENDINEKKQEASLEKIKKIVDQVVDMGALWCLVTGGEPMLREDFEEIYLYLKKKGLLITVFTNATRITENHVRLFKRYPPRNIEVSVYGATKDTYERVTRVKGSYERFTHGLSLLNGAGITTGLKAVFIKSNFNEIRDIFHFCKTRSDRPFRYDPYIHLRYDQDKRKNQMIKEERLTPSEITELTKIDNGTEQELKTLCEELGGPEQPSGEQPYLFGCAAGINHFTADARGRLKICSSLCHPDFVFDLSKESLAHIWHNKVIKIFDLRSGRKEFVNQCASCDLINYCMWCPAISHLETGCLDMPVVEFCAYAKKRKRSVEQQDF